MGLIVDLYIGKTVETKAPAPLAPSDLPLSTSASIVLVPANLLERYQCWHLNAHAWRGPLTISQYLGRESLLEHQSLNQDGQITYWILTDESLPFGDDGARPILASCESLRKEGYVARNGHLEKLVTHGIGSVFCRSDYRGRGYASRMMTDLGKRLETWQQSKGSRAAFSCLWSDIGPRFYTAHGWKAMPSSHISLPPICAPASAGVFGNTKDNCIRDLSAHDLQTRICPKAIARLEAQLRTKSKGRPAVTYMAIRPDYNHMAWHHAREEFQTRLLRDTNPDIKGVEDPVTGCAILWSRVYGDDPADNKLHVLHTIVPEGDSDATRKSLAALLLRGQLEARAWDMRGGVELWSPATHVVEAAKFLMGEEKAKITRRDKESISSVRWVRDCGDEEVDWVCNEKFAWC
jgi:GNAT superfamily N-acetyltransferase